MSTVFDHVRIEFVILADRAEAVNGKLYMMGGLYDRHVVSNLSDPPTINVVISILVPWALTNQQHTIKLRFETEDGVLVGEETSVGITSSRPVHAIQGQMFRAMVIPSVRIKFPDYGAYRVVAEGPNGEITSTTFYILRSLTDSSTKPSKPPAGEEQVP